MSAGILIQILFNLIFLASIIVLWVRAHRPSQEDPRLSRGLQLLQNKISVLEDLSDRSDLQVQQLSNLLEGKYKEIQDKLIETDQILQRIDQSIMKSLEVTEIFQDKIPHQEIIERQNTIKYVKAAKMAHEGASVDEICSAVDLTRGEIEMIAQVNRDQLMFSEESLPIWAQKQVDSNQYVDQFQQHLLKDSPIKIETLVSQNENLHLNIGKGDSSSSEANKVMANKDEEALKNLGEKFKMALDFSSQQFSEASTGQAPFATNNQPKVETIVQNGKTLQIKPVQFKKIDLDLLN